MLDYLLGSGLYVGPYPWAPEPARCEGWVLDLAPALLVLAVGFVVQRAARGRAISAAGWLVGPAAGCLWALWLASHHVEWTSVYCACMGCSPRALWGPEPVTADWLAHTLLPLQLALIAAGCWVAAARRARDLLIDPAAQRATAQLARGLLAGGIAAALHRAALLAWGADDAAAGVDLWWARNAALAVAGLCTARLAWGGARAFGASASAWQLGLARAAGVGLVFLPWLVVWLPHGVQQMGWAPRQMAPTEAVYAASGRSDLFAFGQVGVIEVRYVEGVEAR